MAFEEGLKNCPDNIVLKEGLKRVKDDELCKRFYHDMKITNVDGEKAEMTQSHHQIKQSFLLMGWIFARLFVFLWWGRLLELCKRFHLDMKITNVNGENAEMTQSHHQIKQLLETHLPGLQKEDVEKYCKFFANEGFDSAQTFKELEEEDFDTMKMKKGHKRALLKSLKKEE